MVFCAHGEPLRCGVCKRLYNPTLAACPFCARESATYRKPPTASRSDDDYKRARAEIEAAESRARTVMTFGVLGALTSVLFAIALAGKVHTMSSGHVGTVAVIALVGALAGAIVGPRLVDLDGRMVSQRVSSFVFGYVVSAALTYVLYVGLALGTASHAKKLTCVVTGHSYAKRSRTTPATTRASCELPNGSWMTLSDAHSLLPHEVGRRFTVDAREGLAIWFYDPGSYQPTYPSSP